MDRALASRRRLAFAVSARTKEIGIRMSLGAGPGRVQRMILTEGGVLVVIGLVLGVGVAFFAARVIQGLLFGIAACWMPARRAARIDPAITMRSL